MVWMQEGAASMSTLGKKKVLNNFFAFFLLSFFLFLFPCFSSLNPVLDVSTIFASPASGSHAKKLGKGCMFMCFSMKDTFFCRCFAQTKYINNPCEGLHVLLTHHNSTFDLFPWSSGMGTQGKKMKLTFIKLKGHAFLGPKLVDEC